MKKIKITRNEYTKLNKEDAQEFYCMDADALELLENKNNVVYLYVAENNNVVQSAIIEKNENPANIDIWGEDSYEDVESLIEIIENN